MSEYLDFEIDPKLMEYEWIEFDEQIYTGEKHKYTSGIDLSRQSDLGRDWPNCLAFWCNDKHWGFVFEGGSACLVPHSRVRFVKLRVKERTQVPTHVEDQHVAVAEMDDVVDHVEHTPQATPKRRGRPPKVRP